MSIIKKGLGCGCLSVFVIVIICTATLVYLAKSADTACPDDTFPTGRDTLLSQGNVKTYGTCTLSISDDSLIQLYAEGDPSSRGYAMGRLMEKELYLQEKVFVDQIHELVPSDSYIKFLRGFIAIFNHDLGKYIPLEYRREIYGISQSCTHEYDDFGDPYERQLNYHSAHDIGHAMQDYMLVGCSSFAVWGEKSADGKLLVGRNFDFYMGDAFAKQKLLTVCRPDSGYTFISIGWPGMIGVLSGMNEKGLTVTINAAKGDMPTSSATPISILAREILQYASNIEEAEKIASRRKTFVSESILIGSATESCAAIIEKSPEKQALFKTDISACKIVCTNHYQSDTFKTDERNIDNINNSDSKYRFDRLEKLIGRLEPIDQHKAANILRDTLSADDTPLGMGNEMALNQMIAHHSVIFKPAELKMWVSTSPWQMGKYVCYDLKQIIQDQSKTFAPTDSLTIAADSFVGSAAMRNLMEYRKLSKEIRSGKDTTLASVEEMIRLNQNYYKAYVEAGKYYKHRGETAKAMKYWQKALRMPIPHKEEAKELEQMLTEK